MRVADRARTREDQCTLCGHAPLRPYGLASDPGEALHVAQWECPACRVLCARPFARPDELAAYYAGEYYTRLWRDPDAVWQSRLPECDVELRLMDALLPRRLRGGRALDVGCGYGALLHRLRERGYDVHGCEIGQAAAAFCHQRGLKVVRASAPDLPFPPRSFQLVTAFHVIEHVRDPREFVGALAAMVAPGGALVLVTDHRWSTYARWRRLIAWARGRVPPFSTSTDHTFVFAPRHLDALLQAAGCVEVRTAGFCHVAAGERFHWRAYRGTFRTLDRWLGRGDYLMVTGIRGEG